MKKPGICQLCLQQKELISSSHIIPEFMYKPLYDINNQMFMKFLERPGNIVKRVQTGIFDKHILCEDCDNRLIGQLEHYFASILFDNKTKGLNIHGTQDPNGTHVVNVSGLNYPMFKLFLLSILWRAHISKNSFFQKIDIQSNAETFRKMILNRDPGRDVLFRIAVAAIKDKSGGLVRLVTTPEVKNLGGGLFTTFVINGFIYFIDLQPASTFRLFDKYPLLENGEIRIPVIHGKLANDLLKGLGIGGDMADYFTDSN